MQALYRVDRRGDPAPGAGHPPQPRGPGIAHRYRLIGLVYLLQSRIDEAIVWLEEARSAMPTVPWHHSHLPSAYALRGETERAADALAEARRLSGDNRYSSIANMKAALSFRVPKAQALFEATNLAGLRKAGMPEE